MKEITRVLQEKIAGKEGISREMLSGLFASKIILVPVWGVGCCAGRRLSCGV